MRTVAIVQARMGSTRFPGKVMRPIKGTPMIGLLLDRLANAELVDQVVLATTGDPRDDPLAQYAREHGYAVFRGSEEDVLDRFYQAAADVEGDTLVRITGDCPLVDPKLVDTIILRFLESGADYASNTSPSTYPDGLDVEVFSFSAQETRKEVTVQIFFVCQVGGKVPVVPAVIATHGNLVPSGGGTGDSDGDRVRLASGAGQPHHLRPWVNVDQPLGQVYLLRAVESGHVAGKDGLPHSFVHLRMTIAECAGAYVHDGHVDVLPPIHIPDSTSLGLAEVGRPLLRKKHLSPLGEKHAPARYHSLGSLPELLASTELGPLVARQMLIGHEQLRVFDAQGQNLQPAEIPTGVKVLEDLLDDFEVLGLVDRPALP